jgi:hypothetical protein
MWIEILMVIVNLDQVFFRSDQAGNRLAAQLGVSMSGASDLCAFLRMSRSTASRSMGGAGAGDHLSSTNSLQMMALQGKQNTKPFFVVVTLYDLMQGFSNFFGWQSKNLSEKSRDPQEIFKPSKCINTMLKP